MAELRGERSYHGLNAMHGGQPAFDGMEDGGWGARGRSPMQDRNGRGLENPMGFGGPGFDGPQKPSTGSFTAGPPQNQYGGPNAYSREPSPQPGPQAWPQPGPHAWGEGDQNRYEDS